MTRFAILFLLAASTAAGAQALPQVGNLPDGFYSRTACVVPDKKAGRSDPAKYNRVADAYNRCMKTYTANVANDVAHVLFTVNSAVAAARGSAPPASPPPGDGNLPANFYPGPNCTRPDRAALADRPSTRDAKAMEAYNQKVSIYNVEVSAFSGCIQDYVGRAQTDIQAINDAVSAH